MGIFLGLDFGEKRIGVARSDEGGTHAEPVATLEYRSREDLSKQLRDYMQTLKPEKVVVGLPRTLQGEIGFAAKKVLDWVDWLRPQFQVEWILWDERLTTAETERILIEADLSRRKRKSIRDRLAAQRILQGYLDATKAHE